MMKTLFVGVIFILSAGWAYSAVQLASQDFESSGWESEFTGETEWGSKVLRVTSNPRSGSYALRGNQKAGITDPLGAVGDGNLLLDWRGGVDLVSLTPNEMYFSFWFRHDDYNWNDSGDGKLFYFVDDSAITEMMYFAQQLQEGRDSLRITYCNDSNGILCSNDWAEINWGSATGTLYLTNPNVAGSMGEWRHFEYYINYDSHYFSVWVDGNLLTPSNGLYQDGQIDYDPNYGMHWKGIQFFYAASADVGTATDGTEYAAGWQIDDLEFWDGMPGGDTTDPTATITGPTSNPTFQTDLAQVSLSGTAFDDTALSSVTWSCPTCTPTSGTASGASSWTIANIGLSSGDNTITVTATDTSANSGQDSIVVTRLAAPSGSISVDCGFGGSFH